MGKSAKAWVGQWSRPSVKDLAARMAERDARVDDRDPAARHLGDPPPWRSALNQTRSEDRRWQR